MGETAVVQETEWRAVRKFAGYQINEHSMQIRSARTGRILPQYRTPYPDNHLKVVLMKGRSNFPAFVGELYNDAFPEKRRSNR